MIITKILTKIALKIKSEYYTWKYSDGNGKIKFTHIGIKLLLRKAHDGKLELNGNLILDSSTRTPGIVTINIGPNGRLAIFGDFCLGENCKITVSENALLTIGGKQKESASGITCDSIIACNNRIDIGSDMICSWNVFITDCNWHTIFKDGVEKPVTSPVSIGNHNWIGSNVIIGPGTILGDECIVSAFTKLSNSSYPEKSTIGGIIPQIISTKLTWARDF